MFEIPLDISKIGPLAEFWFLCKKSSDQAPSNWAMKPRKCLPALAVYSCSLFIGSHTVCTVKLIK